MNSNVTPFPEKARLLSLLKKSQFNVPDFLYVPAEQFQIKDFEALERFLDGHRESFKVIARSAHPQEELFKSGTFDSVETYADVDGILYAYKKIMTLAGSTKRLTIRRQQIFNHAPDFDIEEMGVIVMPFVEGYNVMAKMIGGQWEYGYCRDRTHKVQSEPFITQTPHDIQLFRLSEKIQETLGFRCEIEFVVSGDGEIYVVQAKDISNVEVLEQAESERSITLDGILRIRKRRNYRERPVYVMDTRQFYIKIIGLCEDTMSDDTNPEPTIDDIVATIRAFEHDMESFALKYQRYAVLGLSIHNPDNLYQVACKYLEEMPELQGQLSKALHKNLYFIDMFLSESDTLISKDELRLSFCSHDAYGIDTVRNPLWTVYWRVDRHGDVVSEFKRIGFKTGDTVGIDISPTGKPTVIRL
ncbi:MAG: hypothetical protein PVG62_01180 [Desulfobacterales bacterium]|jgi:hypothetical protein